MSVDRAKHVHVGNIVALVQVSAKRSSAHLVKNLPRQLSQRGGLRIQMDAKLVQQVSIKVNHVQTNAYRAQRVRAGNKVWRTLLNASNHSAA